MQLKASHPDGYRRPGFALEKESAKLDIQAASAKPKEKQELQREARKLRTINTISKG
jgi:hypothetical protein